MGWSPAPPRHTQARRVNVPVGFPPPGRRNVKAAVPAGPETSVMTPSGQFFRLLLMVWSRVSLSLATETMSSLPEQPRPG
jgi:hypothetical protein